MHFFRRTCVLFFLEELWIPSLEYPAKGTEALAGASKASKLSYGISYWSGKGARLKSKNGEYLFYGAQKRDFSIEEVEWRPV